MTRDRNLTAMPSLLLLLLCSLSLTSASPYISEQLVERPSSAESARLSFHDLAQTGTILVDPNPPPNPKDWVLASPHDDFKPYAGLSHLHRRGQSDPFGGQDGSASSSSSADVSTKTTSHTSSSTSSSSASATTSASSSASTSALPTPFDQGFGGNITQSCQSFMSSMLGNGTFSKCLPFSLLLQNSNSFFQASKSLERITNVLETSCSANVNTCSPLMSSFSHQLSQSSNCASDLSNGNPMIIQAQLGLNAYHTLYTASCLKNPSTSSYCFADAVTNATSPTDSYVYYLPLGVALPGGSQPTCDSCLKQTMNVFELASSVRTSAIAQDYVSAAQLINVNCGPTFVNASLAAASQTGASSSRLVPTMGSLALAMLAAAWFV